MLASVIGAVLAILQPDGRTTSLANTMDLARLVDLAAERLRVSVEYDPGAVKGSVTLRLAGPVDDAGLWEVVNRQLATRGLTTIVLPGADAYSVVQVQAAAGLARIEWEYDASADLSPSEVRASGLRADLRPGFVTIAFRPRPTALVSELIEVGRQIASKPGGQVTALGSSNTLIISDFSARVDQIIAALVRVDQQAEPVVTESVPLKFVSPLQASALAMQMRLKREAAGALTLRGEVIPAPGGRNVMILAPVSDVAGWRDILGSIDQLEPVIRRTYPMTSHSSAEAASLIDLTIRQDPNEEPDPRFRVVTDLLTESLIITATASQHAQIEGILARLADIPASERRQMRSIPVKHRPAADVLSIVDALIDAGAVSLEPNTEGQQASADDRAGITRNPGGLESADAQSPNRGQPDAARAESRPARRSETSDLSLTLDSGTSTILAIGPPRILDQVEALIAALDVRQRQVELQVLLVSLTESQTRALGAEIRGEVGLGEIDLKLASLFGLSSAAGDAVPGLGSAAGLSGLVLSPGEFSVLLRALETVNQGRSLSMPRVIVASSQQATIDAVLQQPFSSINAGDTVSTTSFGGTQDAGTQVTLAPQVSSADHIILEYSISLSAFVGESPAEGLPPPRQQNRLQSIVTIPDGSTIAIGGIELNTESRAVSQIPFLGDLPLVGELLKNRSRTEGRQRFYAFIRPTILRADDFSDLKYLSRQSADDAGVDDEPVLAPRVIR
jgi:general secretion pathway protein D